jgi:hypothetical protein
MKNNIFCPVCSVNFIYREEVKNGDQLICPICGARLEITAVSPAIMTRRFPQEPETEIRERIETYARLKGYVFNEDKELVLEGMLQKHRQYGDFYCPCRFDNVPENVCPCLDTRKGEVRREGKCL